MDKTDNRTTGGRFEQELATVLANHGFWVHVMQQNKAGQPADLIAVKGKFHTLIDCKVISDNNGFAFDRIEENQKYAMRLFLKKANELSYFALKLPDGKVRMVALERCETLKGRGYKRITSRAMETETWSLNDWIDSATVWGDDT